MNFAGNKVDSTCLELGYLEVQNEAVYCIAAWSNLVNSPFGFVHQV